MNTASIREQLHQFIDRIEENKAAAIYTLFEDEIDPDSQRKKLIQREREKYLSGNEKSNTWQEVKELAVNKEQRRGL